MRKSSARDPRARANTYVLLCIHLYTFRPKVCVVRFITIRRQWPPPRINCKAPAHVSRGVVYNAVAVFISSVHYIRYYNFRGAHAIQQYNIMLKCRTRVEYLTQRDYTVFPTSLSLSLVSMSSSRIREKQITYTTSATEAQRRQLLQKSIV